VPMTIRTFVAPAMNDQYPLHVCNISGHAKSS